jgi:hypothetical protein
MQSKVGWPLAKVFALAAMAALHTHAAAALDPMQDREIEDRKDDLIRQLAICESGGHGSSERPIYGGGIHAGRFQFTIRSVVSYVRDRDGRVLSSKDAQLLAQDYSQAAALAKYMIFSRGHFWNWPACSRKLGLARHVTEIKAMTAKRTDVRTQKGESDGD